MPFCQKDQACRNHTCENGGTCIDVIVGMDTKAECVCPTGTTGRHCELSYYCETMGNELCGSDNECQLFNGNYKCECTTPFIGDGCKMSIDDFVPGYVMQLKSQRESEWNDACRFGFSKESKMFLAIVLVVVIIFTVVGFITGHRLIIKYKKYF